MRLHIKGGRVVDPASGKDEIGDLWVLDGKIAEGKGEKADKGKAEKAENKAAEKAPEKAPKKAPAATKPAGGNVAGARLIGRAIAARAKEKGIKQVVFDRGGYIYHGRVKALADAAREAGLEF